MAPLNEKTALFRKLHGPGGILVLPNAWDAGSARLIEETGAKAIATSSAAVSWAHGYADGETIPPETLLNAVREIARVIRVPLSVDAEAGLDATPAVVADLVMKLVEAGACGINLEDGNAAPGLLAAKIKAIKETVKARGADIFINARADVYLRKLAAPEGALKAMIARGNAYKAAGADGFFAPAVANIADIKAIASAVDLPLNVLALPGVPPIAELKAAGVRRISAGSGLARAALGAAKTAAKQLLDEGRYDAMFKPAEGLQNMNALFAQR
ncbi:MAG TPA: isocitrate lyase/phosphoenolpyruvate mutase family protein [Rhizomicrobium sp.]|nr:isocitrate lyase/phosphoenolpyruvate mutase family protein [Rhizomicrobium sp.]